MGLRAIHNYVDQPYLGDLLTMVFNQLSPRISGNYLKWRNPEPEIFGYFGSGFSLT